ncbi:MAG: hypothetical protein LBR71_02105 [Synergistaceae bacterium]|jgi:hypothetical protein|nr:hypothetical protein [Synergistaceae bacterium]
MKVQKEDTAQDYILINQNIERPLYYNLSDCIEKNRKNERCSVFLTTYGGDIHSAFRMGRCIRHAYKKVKVIIPSICKSAGTIFAICADDLAIGDNGELGPLDVQINKPEELAEINSGLNILNALKIIQEHEIEIFRYVLKDLRYGASLSTKLAAEYAVKMAIGSVAPLYSQIDPIKVAEISRAMHIALAYGFRLNEYGNNLKGKEALPLLLSGYPDHGFVIDRKEARRLFRRVGKLSEKEKEIFMLYKKVLFDPSKPFGPSFFVEDDPEKQKEEIHNETGEGSLPAVDPAGE